MKSRCAQWIPSRTTEIQMRAKTLQLVVFGSYMGLAIILILKNGAASFSNGDAMTGHPVHYAGIP